MPFAGAMHVILRGCVNGSRLCQVKKYISARLVYHTRLKPCMRSAAW